MKKDKYIPRTRKFSKDSLTQRERRLNAARHRKIKRRKTMSFYISLLLCLMGVGIFITVQTFFNIKNFCISGSKKYSPEQVKEVMNLDIGQNMFRYRSSDIREKIVNNLVYVDSVMIKKKLPNTLIITISDASPKYLLKSNAKNFFTLSNNMKILEIVQNRDKYENFTYIRGIDAQDKKIGDFLPESDNKIVAFRQIEKSLTDNEFNEFKEIDLTRLRNIKLNYENRIDVVIGSTVQLDYKIKFIKEVLKKRIGKDVKGTLDASNIVLNSKTYFSPYKPDILGISSQDTESSSSEKNVKNDLNPVKGH